MNVSMIGLMLGCIANIILDPLLIFGIGFFPKMGMRGAALATGIGQLLTLIFYLFAYFLRPISVRISRKYLIRDKHLDLKLYGIGIPAILNLALPSLLISFLNGLLAAYDQCYVVASESITSCRPSSTFLPMELSRGCVRWWASIMVPVKSSV